MMSTIIKEQAPVPTPSYQRAQARLLSALHIDALTLITTLHLLTLCGLVARVANRRCSPPLPAGKGGAPLTYSEARLLLIGLLRTLWRLSYQDMRDWLWPVGCPWTNMDNSAFQANPNSANAATLPEHLCMSHSLS